MSGSFIFYTYFKEELMMTITTEIEHEQEKVTRLLGSAAEGLAINTDHYQEKSIRAISSGMSDEKATDILIKNALENIDESSPAWTFLASRLYLQTYYNKAATNRGNDGDATYCEFYVMVEKLTELKIYSTHIIEKYTEVELEYFSGKIQPDRDWLFDYLCLNTLATRYLATDHHKSIYDLPQERWMIIAIY